jgi:uncharacterized coiled-coil protein SlyX
MTRITTDALQKRMRDELEAQRAEAHRTVDEMFDEVVASQAAQLERIEQDLEGVPLQ